MRVVKNAARKMLSVLLSFIIIFTCINIPYDSVKASTTGVLDNDRTNDSGVVVAVSEQGTPSADWSGFDISMTNNSGGSICDWVIVMQVPSGYASAFKCWNATFEAEGDTIYLYPMSSGANSVLQQGAMSANTPGFGFAGRLVNKSDITVSKVLYNVGSTSTKDYSSGKTDNTGSTGGGTGDGGVNIPAGNLEDFDYDDIEYNYAKLLQYSLYFYDANMCGNDVGKTSLCDWRDDCHTFDSATYTRSDGVQVNVNLNGGFHDAGDHVKFGLPEAYAAFVLGMSYDTDKSAYVSAKQEGHLKNITTHFADYFVNCTVLNADRTKVEAFCCQVGQGGAGYDHGYWGAPENQTNQNRPIFFTSQSQPSTDIVSLTVAALAMQYKNFGGDNYLNTARLLFDYAKNNNKSVGTVGASFYNSTGWEDDYCLAAWLLYDITKDSSYKAEYDKYKNEQNAVKGWWPMGWDNVAPALAYYTDNKTILNNVMGISDGNSTYGGYRCVNDWGSARYNTSMQYTGLLYDKLSNTDSYREWAEGQMKYLLGNNRAKQCFVVGYNDYAPKYPHHRAASGYTGGDKGTTAQKYVLLGALVGGQKTDGTYTDSASDYTCNEVAIDYNATLVAAAAAIYSKYTSDTVNQYVDDTKYVDGSGTGTTPPDVIAVTGVKLDKTTLTLDKGNTSTLKVTVSPSNATDKTVTWKSDNNSVASVNQSGKVTAMGAGKTNITVTSTDGAKTAICEVTVWLIPDEPSAAPSVETPASDSITLEYLEGYEYRIKGGEWQDSNVFTGLEPDKEYIFEVRKKADEANYQQSGKIIEFTVKTLPEGTTLVDVTGVSLDRDSIKLNMEDNKTATISAAVSPENATDSSVQYYSSDIGVAVVDENGLITAVGPGEAVITVKTNHKGFEDTCKVEVYKKYAKPAAPKAEKITTTSVTLKAVSGCQYSKDGKNWQSSNVFTGLKENTTYTFYARKKANGYYTTSNSSNGTKVTTKASPKEDTSEVPDVDVYYRTHVQTFGWEADENKPDSWRKNGAMSGTSGLAKRLEGINIIVNSRETGKKVDLGIQYTTHCQSYGWLPWSADGDMSGTEGEAKRLEAIKIKLTGSDADKYDVYYRVHAQTYGWLNWAKNGEPSGTAGYAKRLEGIQIVVVKKGKAFNKNMENIASVRSEAYIALPGTSPVVGAPSTDALNPVIPGTDTTNVAYRTHVQSYGWQAWKYNGAMSGTSGEAKRLEAINIKLTNKQYDGGINYTTHVQSYGWQGDINSPDTWKKNGEISGTSGEAKRLEAICIVLTGEMEKHYDIYYRVHAQSFGWLDWAKNGEPAGTAGYAKRLEGIEIVLVPKGGAAPGATGRPYVEK